MPIKTIILEQIDQTRGASNAVVPALRDDLALLDSGLDSLGIAILVTRLEEVLGFDPFTDSEITTPPVTLGDFIRIYENAAQSS